MIIGSRVSSERVYIAGLDTSGQGVVQAFAVDPETCALTALGPPMVLTEDGFFGLLSAYRGRS
ncbi:MAG TPA: hypothetical protein VLA09_07025 [Longimicrobiales bacterium]|nr:hypothetical protein [Longimicrobiales bacterium]